MKTHSNTQNLSIINALQFVDRKQLTISCQHCGEEITLVFEETKYTPDEAAANEEYITDQTLINHRAKWVSRLIEE
ncbi:MAG: hypothetical protein AAGE79_14580 [Acinetobacter pittii]